jgi:hypothetical protein
VVKVRLRKHIQVGWRKDCGRHPDRLFRVMTREIQMPAPPTQGLALLFSEIEDEAEIVTYDVYAEAYDVLLRDEIEDPDDPADWPAKMAETIEFWELNGFTAEPTPKKG